MTRSWKYMYEVSTHTVEVEGEQMVEPTIAIPEGAVVVWNGLDTSKCTVYSDELIPGLVPEEQ